MFQLEVFYSCQCINRSRLVGKGQEEILYSHVARACVGSSKAGAFGCWTEELTAVVPEGRYPNCKLSVYFSSMPRGRS